MNRNRYSNTYKAKAIFEQNSRTLQISTSTTPRETYLVDRMNNFNHIYFMKELDTKHHKQHD